MQLRSDIIEEIGMWWRHNAQNGAVLVGINELIISNNYDLIFNAEEL